MPLELTAELLIHLREGQKWRPARERPREFLKELFDERYHASDWGRLQPRAALMGDDAASYAGVITAENPTSGPYQGTSFVWFPGKGGSVAVLVVGTAGFGSDATLLSRPGHRRRLRALARLHGSRLWVKPDLLDLQSEVPEATSRDWPEIAPALKAYGRVIYAAVAVRNGDEAERAAVEDLLDLFMREHGIRLKGEVTIRWEKREREMMARVFLPLSEDDVAATLQERRFLVLQGPPGTGKTRLARKVAARYDSHALVQFHPARTYEDFVIGLAPRPSQGALSFDVRRGDLLLANEAARGRRHVLVLDEINRADLGRILGEAISLFEPGEPDREVQLPYEVRPGARTLRLEPGLMVIGTMNTADRSLARIDIAIRRRFAFLEVWPDLHVVEQEGVDLARTLYADVLATFAEHTDDAGLQLIPGHAYFLDPRPDLGAAGRDARVLSRIRYEVVPLLRSYVDERLAGPATGEIEGLADRIESRL